MDRRELIRSLAMRLPEDISRVKEAGCYDEALKLIEARLAGDLPHMLRTRLICEKERLRRLPLQYPYTREDVVSLMRQTVPDFSGSDLAEFDERGLTDWIYIDGEKRFFIRCHRSLLKYCGLISKENPYLDEMIARIKADGQLTCAITLETSIAVAKEAFTPGEYRAWLPIPLEADQQSGLEILSGDPDHVSDAASPSRSAYWTRTLLENRPFSIRYRYVNGIRFADPFKPAGIKEHLYPSLPPTEDDLSEDGVFIRFTPYLRSLAKEITSGCRNAADKAWAIYCFITQRVRYTFMRQYFQIDELGEYCALNLRGDCGLQALLFIILCRICGIPARWQSGLSIDPDGPGDHDWAQFYLEPFGWLFADPSFGGSAWRAGARERHAFYFGNLDPMRMAANRLFMAPLDPENKGLRFDPYDLQSGEIERSGAESPLLGSQAVTEKILVEKRFVND